MRIIKKYPRKKTTMVFNIVKKIEFLNSFRKAIAQRGDEKTYTPIVETENLLKKNIRIVNNKVANP